MLNVKPSDMVPLVFPNGCHSFYIARFYPKDDSNMSNVSSAMAHATKHDRWEGGHKPRFIIVCKYLFQITFLCKQLIGGITSCFSQVGDEAPFAPSRGWIPIKTAESFDQGMMFVDVTRFIVLYFNGSVATITKISISIENGWMKG